MKDAIERLKELTDECDSVIVGAGAGMSASAGMPYSGERFDRYFADFGAKYGFRDMYAGGFYPFETSEEKWAFWSRNILINRYDCPVGEPYELLREALDGKNYFVLTTNVDHRFQAAGFDKRRLFYTQGDYGLFQCSVPCHAKTYDNEDAVREMVAAQKDMRVPTRLVPRCPVCGAEMTTNLRVDGRFVEDDGWNAACGRYRDFWNRHIGGRVLLLEIGVGLNTPSIIKYPFMMAAAKNKNSAYVSINDTVIKSPFECGDREIHIRGDITETLRRLVGKA